MNPNFKRGKLTLILILKVVRRLGGSKSRVFVWKIGLNASIVQHAIGNT